MSERIDLTGRWTGVYFYPIDAELNAADDLPATPFTAELTDRGGYLTGTTVEPDLTGPPGSPPIEATLEGDRSGLRIGFTKTPAGRQTHTIDYHGAVSADGDMIDGVWIIHGDWSGTFRMQRRSIDEEARVRELARSAARG